MSQSGKNSETLRPTGRAAVQLQPGAPESGPSWASALLAVPEGPVPRRFGPRAELTALIARVARAHAAGADDEGPLSLELARALAARGWSLDWAARLARLAWTRTDAPGLGEELSHWWALLGRHRMAGGSLRAAIGEDGESAVRVGLRAAHWFARAGSYEEALALLRDLAERFPERPEPLEGIGALALPGGGTPTLAIATEALLEAASNRERAGARVESFEALLRAHELDPSSEAIADRLIEALVWRGRLGAADEIARRTAVASPDPVAGHRRRVHHALTRGDAASAVAAAIDADLDRDVEWAAIERASTGRPLLGAEVCFDDLLAHLGLDEWLQARLEVFVALSSEPQAARQLAMRLLDSEPMRARWLLARAASHPDADAAFLQRCLALVADDASLLVDIVCIAAQRGTDSAQRCLHDAIGELVRLVEGGQAEPELLPWAVSKASGQHARWSEAVRRAERHIERHRARFADVAATIEAEEHLDAWLRLLPVVPGADERLIRTMLARLRERPDDLNAAGVLERVLGRMGQSAELPELLAPALGESGAPRDALRLVVVRILAPVDAEAALGELLKLAGREDLPARVALTTGAFCAVLGDDAVRARGHLNLSTTMSSALSATLAAAAARGLVAEQPERSWELVSTAMAHDPTSARAAAAIVELAGRRSGRDSVDALERAVQVIVASAEICQIASRLYTELGQPGLALVWAQRRLALRPGDLAAVTGLLEAARCSDVASHLAGAIREALHQPLAVEALAPLVAQELLVLAERDERLAVAMAWAGLEALGPADSTMRRALGQMARRVGAPGLSIAMHERWDATGERVTAKSLLELGRLRHDAGDADGAVWALSKALDSGAEVADVMAELDAMAPSSSSDGALWFTEVQANCFERLGDHRMAASAWRQAGALRWDLAGDIEGAIRCWERGAALHLERGLPRYAVDVVAFGGHQVGLERLEEFAASRELTAERAQVLAVAAGVAHRAGLRTSAFDLAERSLQLVPTSSQALDVAEQCSDSEDHQNRLAAIYGALAEAALGNFGERAVHYRAARHFADCGHGAWALQHAELAVRAVPAAGVALELFDRVATAQGQAVLVRRVLRDLADEQAEGDQRAKWLIRAAKRTVASLPAAEDLEQRVELIFAAFDVTPTLDVVAALEGTLSQAPREYRERAAESLACRCRERAASLSGPTGARVALVLARLVLEQLERSDDAWALAERALGCDARIDEYGGLAPSLPQLSSARQGAARFVEAVLQRSAADVGRAALALGLAVARELSDSTSEVLILECLAMLEPDDQDALREALLVAAEADQSETFERLLDGWGETDQVNVLWDLASRAEKRGDRERALGWLGRLAQASDTEVKRQARARIRSVLAGPDHAAARAERLSGWLQDSDLGAEERVGSMLDLATCYAVMDEPKRGFALLRNEIEHGETAVSLLDRALELAREAVDPESELWALQRFDEVLPEEGKLTVLRDLAELFEARRDFASAASAWERVLKQAPRDPDALAALQREAERRGDYGRFAELIERRIQLTEADEQRRLRLHRAAVLDQRLGRSEQARDDLLSLLDEQGDQLSVLRVLADLQERLGDPGEAAQLWERASLLAGQVDEAARLRARAVEHYLHADDPEGASQALEHPVVEHLSDESRLRLRVSIARRKNDHEALAGALELYADVSTGTTEDRAALLLEASYVQLDAGDPEVALRLAQRAAAMVPTEPDPQLLARWLEYLRRGTGDEEVASETISQLRGMRGDLTDEQVELRAFLVAEALDRAAGVGSGLRELTQAQARCGQRPLVAAGLAERFARSSDPRRALELFDIAIGGELRGLRERGELALHAAEACLGLGELDRGRGYLAAALAEPESRHAAQRLAECYDVQRVRHDAVTEPPAPAQEPGPADASPSADRADASGRLLAAIGLSRRVAFPSAAGPSHPDVEAREAVEEVSKQGLVSSASDAGTVEALPPEGPRERTIDPDPVAAFPEVVEPQAQTQASEPSALSSGPGAAPEQSSSEEPAAEQGAAARQPTRHGKVSMDEEVARVVPHLSSTTIAAASAQEAALLSAFQQGDVEAGERLAEHLDGVPERTQDLVGVCRHLALMGRGDPGALQRLVAAALADRNAAYASAVQHASNAVGGGSTVVAPPPLAQQAEHPDVVQSLILRELPTVSEALALVLEGAARVYRRGLPSYGVTGVERVGVQATGIVAATYHFATRWFGLGRVSAFQRRSAERFAVRVALCVPPALIVTGEPPEQPQELEWAIATHLVGAMPAAALVYGLDEETLRTLLSAMLLAFGPPEADLKQDPVVANLAELLWQTLPGRSQRRLRELCDDVAQISVERALDAAGRACRRAGLLFTGDLELALQHCLADTMGPAAPANAVTLREFCQGSSAALDLLSLAISPEYAEIRWQRTARSIPPATEWGYPPQPGGR